MAKVKAVKKVAKSAKDRLAAGRKKLEELKKTDTYPPQPYNPKGPAKPGGMKVVDNKGTGSKKSTSKKSTKKKTSSKKSSTTQSTKGVFSSITKGVADISHAMGVGGRAFVRNIKNKPVAQIPTKVTTHVGKHKIKYGTATIVGSNYVSNKSGTSAGRRQATKDLKI